MKPYLLIAGYQYYPDRGTGDWIGCYATEEEAEKKWKLLQLTEYSPYDWYDIVDLREWMDDET
jgi:hypothetical protein